MCKRKPAARRLRKKALYCPFLKEGVRNVARSMVKLPTLTFVRARAHSNPLSKRARLFPSAAYRRSAPPQSAWGKLTPCGVGYFGVAGRFCGVDKQAGSLFPRLAAGKLTPCGLGYFGVAGRLCCNDEWALFPVRTRREAYLPLAGWDSSVWLGNFAAWMKRLIFFFHDWRRAHAFLAA